MTDKELQQLKDAIAAEEERRKKAAERAANGEVMIDLEPIEARIDAVIINGNNSVKLLERLNIVGDKTYAKLEELSLKLLEVMAIGMPLLKGR